MVINRIHIQRFGALCDREFTVMPGLNIIEGENESGKTTVAAFLRYIFYGIANNTAASHFLKVYPAGYPTGVIGGSLDITLSAPLSEMPDVICYRITRQLSVGADDGDAVERCIICPLYGEDVGAPVLEGAVPGEVFFGVSGEVFSASAFVGQVNSAAHTAKAADLTDHEHGNYTGGSPIRAAIDRILHAANEEIDPDAAVHSLYAKRNALYNPDTETGSIRELERRRAALQSALESALSSAEENAADADEPEVREDVSHAEPAPEMPDEAQQEQLRASVDACDRAIAEKEVRISRLQKLREQYEAYRALDDIDTLKTLREQQSAAEMRAASLAATMFRGSYIPDADFTASLHLCAEDMREASEQSAAAKAELERLDFSVRRDNIKEKQLRRIELDGGADAIRARLDKLYSKRSVVTVFGIFFLLFTVFACATTIFLLILHSDTYQNGILITAILVALSFFFFLSRGKYERSIGVMLKRYNCTTEDELENFIEEYVLSSGKLKSITDNKESLSTQMSELSLRGSEAARQAALLLSKLQPPDAVKITPDRLTPEVVSTAADRIDRTLGELNRLYQTADACKDEITRYLEEHHAQSEEALHIRRKTLAALFEKNGTPFRIDQLQGELDSAAAAVQELHHRRDTLRALLEQPMTAAPAPVISAAPKRSFRRAVTCDCGPDPRILRALIAELDEKLRRDRKQYAALNLAIDALRRASTALHQSIAPRLTENAGKLMALLSDQRYSALILDNEMHLRAAQNTGDGTAEVLPIGILSAGTQDLAYLSLRMALLHMLYPKEQPPLLFDEAFATLDDKRLTRMIALLHRASSSEDPETSTSQAIVFTCHKRERRAAQALAACHVLKL